MNKLTILSTVAALLVTSTAAFATTRALPAMSGHGWPFSSAGCFSSAWAEVQNTCSSSQTFIIPMTAETPNAVTQSYSVYVTAVGTQSAPVSCRSIVNDGPNGWLGSVKSTANGFGAARQTLNLGSISVAEGRTIHVDCSLAPSTKIYAVQWGF